MRRIKPLGIAALVVLSGVAFGQATASAANAAAQPAATQAADLPAGEAVLQRFIEVTGGADAWKKITTRRTEGKLELAAMGLTGTLKIEQAAPNLMRYSMEIPGAGAQEQATDGTHVWSNSPMTGPAVAEGEEREQFLRMAAFNAELNPTDYYTSIKTVGIEDVDGVKCYKLELTPKSGNVETRFYGVESGLLVKTLNKVQSPMGEVPTESLPGDWRDVDGVKQPFSLVTRQMGMEFKVTFNTIAHNVQFPENHFAVPEDVKPLIKKPGDK